VNVRFHRFTGNAFHEGIEDHAVAGGTVRVYGVAKTIVDCFRLRSKVGTDVAIEALRDGLRSRKTSLDELDGLSRRLRIQTVMRPYLEMEAAS
jgi:predicted transcriptional regulator of viral defense system